MRLAVIGDVHLAFDAEDARAIDAAGYEAVLFAGDLAGYSVRGGLRVARAIAGLRTRAIAIPGNHDAVPLPQFAAEFTRQERAAALLARGQEGRVASLASALGPVRLSGYEVLPLGAPGELDCIVARPHSFGGPALSFGAYLGARYGVDSMERSAELLCARVDEARSERLLFLAHNGPTGLGERRHDPWGRDFGRAEGDFGDPDLRAAIDHARASGRQVVAVVAGHMHRALRGGGERTWQARQDGTLFVNAARVPRIFEDGGRTRRHRVELVIEGHHAEARDVLE